MIFISTRGRNVTITDEAPLAVFSVGSLQFVFCAFSNHDSQYISHVFRPTSPRDQLVLCWYMAFCSTHRTMAL